MRKDEREIKDHAAIEAVLRAGRTAVLALCRDGEPYAVPVSYAYVPGQLIFHGARRGLKMELIAANPRVSFNVVARDELLSGSGACDWTCHYQSVTGIGTARILDDIAEKRGALAQFMRHYAEGPFEFPDAVLGVTRVVVVDIERLTGKQNPPPRLDG